MKTIYSISAIGNVVAKTFDIIKTWYDGSKEFYRTTELSEQEFEEMGYNTEKDWQNFLNTSQDYYTIDADADADELRVKKATLSNNGERVIITDNTRDLGHGKQIEVIYADNTRGWEYETDLIDIDEN